MSVTDVTWIVCQFLKSFQLSFHVNITLSGLGNQVCTNKQNIIQEFQKKFYNTALILFVKKVASTNVCIRGMLKSTTLQANMSNIPIHASSGGF